MRKYETIFILHPSLDEEACKAAIEKFKGVIENGGGTIENVDFWGITCNSEIFLHIQSYFIAFKPQIFKNIKFENFILTKMIPIIYT